MRSCGRWSTVERRPPLPPARLSLFARKHYIESGWFEAFHWKQFIGSVSLRRSCRGTDLRRAS